MVVKALVHLGVDIADHCVVTASAARAVKPTIANAVNSLVCCAPGMAIASEVSKAFGKCLDHTLVVLEQSDVIAAAPRHDPLPEPAGKRL